MAGPILVIAVGDDLHARAVVDALRKRQVCVEWIDFASLTNRVYLTFELGSQVRALLRTDRGKRIDVADFQTLWWRRPRRPKEMPGLDDDTREYLRGEWEHFLLGLESCASGRWVNSPRAERAAVKVRQLILAQEEGLRVPFTAVTNDPEQVRAMVAGGGRLIYKRLGPAVRPVTATKELVAADLDRLDALPNCPAIIQEYINASVDIRVTVIGSDCVAVEIDSQSGTSSLDWRFDQTVPFRRHQLDHGTERRLRAVMESLNLVYAAIDLRLTPEGEYVFFEINPSGQYLFVELLAGVPLTDRMAEFLATG